MLFLNTYVKYTTLLSSIQCTDFTITSYLALLFSKSKIFQNGSYSSYVPCLGSYFITITIYVFPVILGCAFKSTYCSIN